MYENHKRFRTSHKVERKCSYFQVIDTGPCASSYTIYLEQLPRTIREICLRISILGIAACAGGTVCGYTRACRYTRERDIKGVQGKQICGREREMKGETEKGISMHARDPDSNHPRNVNLSEFAGTRKIIRPIEFRYAV